MSLDPRQRSAPGPPPYAERTALPLRSPDDARGNPSSTSAVAAASTFPPATLPNAPLPLSRLELLSTRLSAPFITSFSGSVSGIASGIVTCPLDVIKTKLQAQGGFRTSLKPEGAGASAVVYRGLLGTASSILRDEGPRGMYRGLFPMLLGYFPTWAVYFTVYEGAKGFWYQQFGKEDLSSRKKLLAHVLTSVTAGTCSTLATNPIWVIKTRLMSQTAAASHANPIPGGDGHAPWHYKSTWDAARKMYAHEGMASFYSGLTPALLGLTHVAVQFPLYEYLKFRFTGLEMGQEQRPGDDGGGGGGGGSHWLGMCVATMLSKVCASMATYPHEVIRTRLQTQQVRPASAPSAAAASSLTASQRPYASRSAQAPSSPLTAPPGSNEAMSASRPASASASASPPAPASAPAPRYRGIMHTVRTILHEEGWRAFYVGMGTNLIRAVPAAATTILTYEYVVGSIKKLQSDANRKLGASAAE